jgi:RNA polymerase-binding protein DksA
MVSALTEHEQEQLRDQLEHQRAQLCAEVEREMSRSARQGYDDLIGQVGDLEDRALADLLVDENLAAVHRHVQELRQIEDALARMKQGSYGECIDCGDVIGFERLRAFATATRCIDCQARYERDHAEPGHPTL